MVKFNSLNVINAIMFATTTPRSLFCFLVYAVSVESDPQETYYKPIVGPLNAIIRAGHYNLVQELNGLLGGGPSAPNGLSGVG